MHDCIQATKCQYKNERSMKLRISLNMQTVAVVCDPCNQRLAAHSARPKSADHLATEVRMFKPNACRATKREGCLSHVPS